MARRGGKMVSDGDRPKPEGVLAGSKQQHCGGRAWNRSQSTTMSVTTASKFTWTRHAGWRKSRCQASERSSAWRTVECPRPSGQFGKILKSKLFILSDKQAWAKTTKHSYHPFKGNTLLLPWIEYPTYPAFPHTQIPILMQISIPSKCWFFKYSSMSPLL